MNIISDGCRLCLDPFGSFTTIGSPVLKRQMEKVFCFSIEPKQGYCSGVCQSCSFTISEFYQYSEKVSQNQEVLNKNVPNYDPTIDPKISIQSVKHETLSDSESTEKTEDASESKDPVLGEEASISSSNITLQSVKVETLNDSVLPKNTDDDNEPKGQALGDENIPIVDSEISIENVKIETFNDSELLENTDDDCEPEDQAMANEDVAMFDSEISLEDVKIEALSASELPETTEKINKKTQNLTEEDQLFKKHFRMTCDLCGMLSDSFSSLCSHFKTVHKRSKGYVVCCKKKLFQRWTIREHIEFHANPEIFRCKECGMTFKSSCILNKHMLNRHSYVDQHPFKCDHCPHSFSEKLALAEHMTWHMKVECSKCNKLIIKSYLKNHMSQIHSDKERTMVCETCGKEFLTKQYFEQHIKAHKGIEVQKVQCEICQRWLKGEKSLRNHIKMLHTDDAQEVQCNLCPKKYKNSRLLYSHKQWAHAEPKYECEFCGKKYKVACRLKDHRAIHTGEVVTCKYCGITKCNKHYLYKHIKQHHSAELAQKKLIGIPSVLPNKSLP